MLLNLKQTLITLVALALGATSSPLEKRSSAAVAFFNPAAGGGSMLDVGKYLKVFMHRKVHRL